MVRIRVAYPVEIRALSLAADRRVGDEPRRSHHYGRLICAPLEDGWHNENLNGGCGAVNRKPFRGEGREWAGPAA